MKIKLIDIEHDLKTFLYNVQKSLIEQALAKTKNNHLKTAALLGINRTTLIMKIKTHGIKEQAFAINCKKCKEEFIPIANGITICPICYKVLEKRWARGE